MPQPSTFGEDQGDAANNITVLSNRQMQVLGLVAEGATDNEIAIQLGLSAKTISFYMNEIRARLDARSRAHAVALAMRQGILSGTPSPEQGS
jgi:DNA-binding CsgD family transcriptional regulator